MKVLGVWLENVVQLRGWLREGPETRGGRAGTRVGAQSRDDNEIAPTAEF